MIIQYNQGGNMPIIQQNVNGALQPIMKQVLMDITYCLKYNNVVVGGGTPTTG